MELVFLINAVRRYFWMVVVGALIGVLPGLFMSSMVDELYESRAVLLIAPPTQTRATTINYNGDPNRYVAGELSVLESLSDRVAAEIDDTAVEYLGTHVQFLQQPQTDVVVVVAQAGTPELAQQVADTYVSEYFDVLRAQLAGTQDPALRELDAELEQVRSELAEVDAQITAALAPYLSRDAVPDAALVAPALTSEKGTLVTRYNELQAARSELNSGLRVSSRVVRDATLPAAPIATSNRMLIVVGGAGGAFAGLLAAVVTARLSRRVLDDVGAEGIIGHDIVGTMPEWAELHAERSVVLAAPEPVVAEFIDALGVRVEAINQGSGPVTAVVCGADPGSGTTTVAAALARHLAASGLTTLLVDGDRHHAELSMLILGGGVVDSDQAVVLSSQPDLLFVTLPALRGLASAASEGHSRPDAAALLTTAKEYADVVIVDGGALMGSATTVQLSRESDVVVLAIRPGQEVRGLESAAAELRSIDHLLPVWVPVDPRGASSALRDKVRRERPSDSVDAESLEVVSTES